MNASKSQTNPADGAGGGGGPRRRYQVRSRLRARYGASPLPHPATQSAYSRWVAGWGSGPKPRLGRLRRGAATREPQQDLTSRRRVSADAQRHVQLRGLHLFHQAEGLQGGRRRGQPDRLVQAVRHGGLETSPTIPLAGLDPAIHVFKLRRLEMKTWTRGSSPREARVLKRFNSPSLAPAFAGVMRMEAERPLSSSSGRRGGRRSADRPDAAPARGSSCGRFSWRRQPWRRPGPATSSLPARLP